MIQLMLLGAAVFSTLLAAIVLANNHTRAISRVYVGLSLLAAIWLSVNALVLNGPLTPTSHSVFLFVGRLITPSAVILSFLMMLFIIMFANGSTVRGRKFVYAALPGIPIVALSFTRLNVYLGNDGSLQLGNLSIPFVAVVFLYLGTALYYLFFRFKSRRDEVYATQVRYLRNAFLVSIIPAVSFGAVFPLFTTSQISNLGPIFSTIFLLFAAWLIIRHKLFDVKPIVAKVIAYGLLLATTVSFFSFFAIFVTRHTLNITNEFVAQEVVPFGLAMLIALVLKPTKQFFDRFTNRLFYQDAYDPQTFLDDLNKAMVSSIEIERLLGSVLQVIETHIKASYAAFVIHKTAQSSRHLIQTTTGLVDWQMAEEVGDSVTKVRGRVVFVDDLVDTESHFTAYKVSVAKHLSVVAKLSATPGGDGRSVGLLLLGDKKSGSPYNGQDRKVLEIIVSELVIAIQNSLRFEEIENFNRTLQDKIEKATRQLRHTNERLRILDHTKDDFISMASHQLRTPLTSIKGYLSMVLEGDAGKLNNNQYKLLEQSFFSAQRMVYLIGDLLNLSRLSTGKFVIEAKPLDLSNVVQAEIDQLRETAKAREVTLIYDKPAALPMMMLDETKIHQVVMNLVDNAIYYTPAGGSVTVDLHETPTAIECLIKDTGIGVPKAVQHRLFTKFYRAQNAQRARPDGTGLGLFMVRKTIAAHGGSIIFQSQEGTGSTFGFRFSKAAHLASAAQPHGAPATPVAVKAAAGATALTH